MFRIKFSYLFFIIFLASTTGSSQAQMLNGIAEEIVVSATRTATAVRELATSVTVITEEEIKHKGQKLIVDFLRTVPSLDISKNGGLGGTASIFIRGAKSEHTLVLIDGIESNDPISPSKTFDLAHITTDNVEKIEIIRGPQSTLYGSDAIGGIINIITKKGSEGQSISLSTEGGTYGTTFSQAGYNGSKGIYKYSFGVSKISTDGISAAGEKWDNTENDGYNNTTYSSRLGIDFNENAAIDLTARYYSAESDIDNSGGIGGDDPNNIITTEQLFFSGTGIYKALENRWEQQLNFSYSDIDRKNNNGIDTDHPDDLIRAAFKGANLRLSWQNIFKPDENNIITAGLDIEEENGSSDYYSESSWGPFTSIFDKKSSTTKGFYFQDQLSFNNSFFSSFGVRFDSHDKFGSRTTFKFAPAYYFNSTDTKLKFTFGTGFKSPTLYQLYSQYGDESLDPEESTGFDAGFEQFFNNGGIKIEAAIFFNKFDNLIDFDSNLNLYDNIAKSESNGLELMSSFRINDNLSFSTGYTFTNTEDKTTGELLLRRAKHKLNFNSTYLFLEHGSLNLNGNYVGEREDMDFSTWPAERVTLDPYILLNFAGSYDFSEYFQLYGRIDNLLDEEYEDVRGYGTLGRTLTGGLRFNFNK